MLKKIPLWVQILIGIAIGAIIVVAVPDIVPYISFLGDIFLRLLKMLIAPLVLLTLINGVCKMGDVGMLRKVGVRIRCGRDWRRDHPARQGSYRPADLRGW